MWQKKAPQPKSRGGNVANKMVAGARIELATQGFSVPCSTDWAIPPLFYKVPLVRLHSWALNKHENCDYTSWNVKKIFFFWVHHKNLHQQPKNYRLSVKLEFGINHSQAQSHCRYASLHCQHSLASAANALRKQSPIQTANLWMRSVFLLCYPLSSRKTIFHGIY